ncbi:MAG: type 1 glutamine amidotransferase [Nitrospirota bacterium]|nr:type 1 glutamine amidotransferase [Nitrospirota bacterium]
MLILKNTITEGPGTIEDFLNKEAMPFSIVELGRGEIPPPLERFDTLVVMGGPMGVYEMDKYPHLMIGSHIIREAINRNMRILGICLGAQLIVYCLGAEVYKGHEEETGWRSIELTGDGLKDPLMRKLAVHPQVGDFWRKFKVFQWHGDTFDLPIGAVSLAKSELYTHQAFRYKDNVYGFQFHIEVTTNMLLEWFKNSPEMPLIMRETEEIFEEYTGRATNFYNAFLRRK